MNEREETLATDLVEIGKATAETRGTGHSNIPDGQGGFLKNMGISED